jgi:hypothetical protein
MMDKKNIMGLPLLAWKRAINSFPSSYTDYSELMAKWGEKDFWQVMTVWRYLIFLQFRKQEIDATDPIIRQLPQYLEGR